MNFTGWEKRWKELLLDYENTVIKDVQNNVVIESNEVTNNKNLLVMLLYGWQKYGINKTFSNWLNDLIEDIDLSKTVVTDSLEHPMWKAWNEFEYKTFK